MNKPHIRATGNGAGVPPVPISENSKQEPSSEQKFLEYFGLSEQPFGVTPDPRFLYLGPKHKQALTALNYGTELNRGFLTLISQPGMGKTSLIFNYLEGLRNKARTVFLFQSGSDSRDLMSYMLADMGIDPTGKNLPEMHSILNQALTEQMHMGRRFVLVIDEAQNLTEEVLESVRLLSNFETPWMKLMHIVLAGQPQLDERLASPSMAQLKQRISFAIHIDPLVKEEVDAYIDHRLWVAGHNGEPLFSIGARNLLAEHSEGIPRKINNLCFCAMSLAYASNQKTVDREMMRDVLVDANLLPPVEKPVEKKDLAPKPVERKPFPRVTQNLRPVAFTVKEPPARAWLPKFLFACALIFLLGWSGFQIGMGTRLASLWHVIPFAEKSSAVPAIDLARVDSAAPASSDTSLLSPAVEPATEDKNPVMPQPGEGLTTLSNREPN